MSFLKNLLLLLVSLVVVLIFGEFAVRMAFDGITSTSNMQTWFGQRWKDEFVELNSLGFRDREFGAVKPKDVTRIVILGDSFAFGQGLPVEDRFSNIIERTLNQSGKNYEVLNISRPGLATADELVLLNEVVLPLDPDFIIVQWLPNDFQGRSSPSGPRMPTLIPDYQLHQKMQRRSALYFLLNNQWFNLRSLSGTESFDYAENLMRPFANSGSDEYKAAIQPMVELLDALTDSGKDFALILHPLIRPEMGREYQLQPMHDVVMELCYRAGARCFELTPSFVALGPDFDFRDLWVNRFDPHPGREANQLVANYILEELGPKFSGYP